MSKTISQRPSDSMAIGDCIAPYKFGHFHIVLRP